MGKGYKGNHGGDNCGKYRHADFGNSFHCSLEWWFSMLAVHIDGLTHHNGIVHHNA